jgi:hypothetical protein
MLLTEKEEPIAMKFKTESLPWIYERPTPANEIPEPHRIKLRSEIEEPMCNAPYIDRPAPIEPRLRTLSEDPKFAL